MEVILEYCEEADFIWDELVAYERQRLGAQKIVLIVFKVEESKAIITQSMPKQYWPSFCPSRARTLAP